MRTRRKHIPVRSCVVCGMKASKVELTRIVATPQGTVVADPTGKLPGRGAYMCGDDRCLQSRQRKGRLEHALRSKISDADWAGLQPKLDATRLALSGGQPAGLKEVH